MDANQIPRAMGWLPGYPDFLDYAVAQAEPPARVKRFGVEESVKNTAARTA